MLFVHGPGQVCFELVSVSLSPQTSQVDLRSGHAALTVSLALTGSVLGQPGLSDVVPSHVAQIGLCRVCRFGPEISLQLWHWRNSLNLVSIRAVPGALFDVREGEKSCSVVICVSPVWELFSSAPTHSTRMTWQCLSPLGGRLSVCHSHT